MISVLSYGGGLNSTALLVWLVENRKPLDVVIFADTGSEMPHTYDTVKYYENWMKDRGINFVIVKSEYACSLYDYCMMKKTIPSRIRRDCTSKFKISPIRKWLRKSYGKKERFLMHIGIDYGEAHRMRTSDVSYITNNYPLVDDKISREGCKNVLKQNNLLVPEKSGCFFCPFTKKASWLSLLREFPTLYDASIILEKNGRRYPAFLLNTIPLEKIKLSLINQRKLEDFETTCDVSGSCFL